MWWHCHYLFFTSVAPPRDYYFSRLVMNIKHRPSGVPSMLNHWLYIDVDLDFFSRIRSLVYLSINLSSVSNKNDDIPLNSYQWTSMSRANTISYILLLFCAKGWTIFSNAKFEHPGNTNPPEAYCEPRHSPSTVKSSGIIIRRTEAVP